MVCLGVETLPSPPFLSCPGKNSWLEGKGLPGHISRDIPEGNFQVYTGGYRYRADCGIAIFA